MTVVNKDKGSDSLCILIPVYNKLEYTKKCLADLKEAISAFTETVEIVIIDDGSRDATEEWIHNHHPEVTVLKGTGNLFWSGAMNRGIQYAISEKGHSYVLLWNNDVKTGVNYFDNLFEVIKNKPEGITGAKILTLIDHNVVWSFGGYFNPKTGKKGMIGYFDKDGEEYSKGRSVDWCTGMGTLIHKKVIESIGFIDEKLFPQYFGDTDFTYRAKLAGYQVFINPKLILYNDTINTGLRPQNGLRDLIRSLFDIRSNLNLKSNYGFIKKHASSYLAYITMSMFYVRVLGGFVKWSFLKLLGKKRKSDAYYKNKI